MATTSSESRVIDSLRPRRRRPRSRRGVLLAVLPAVLLLAVLFGGAPAAGSVEVNRVMLRVNDRIATMHDYQLRLSARRAALLRAPELSEEERDRALAEAPASVLRTIWEELLIASRADQLGIVISQQQVEDAIAEQMQRFQLEDVDQLRMALAQEGLTLDRFRDSLANNLLFRAVMGRELFPRIQVSEDELRAIYRQRSDDFLVPEQVRVRELVVLGDGSSDEEEQGRIAARLREQWQQGGEPQQLADDAGDAVRLLEIGWVGPGDLASELEQAAWELEAGEISEPIVARGGVHVLQVTERRESSIQPFEQVREAIAEEERALKMRTEQEKYLLELEQRAYYEASPPPGLEEFRTATGRTLDEGGMRILEDLARPDLASDPSAAAPVEEEDEEQEEAGEDLLEDPDGDPGAEEDQGS